MALKAIQFQPVKKWVSTSASSVVRHNRHDDIISFPLAHRPAPYSYRSLSASISQEFVEM